MLWLELRNMINEVYNIKRYFKIVNSCLPGWWNIIIWKKCLTDLNSHLTWNEPLKLVMCLVYLTLTSLKWQAPPGARFRWAYYLKNHRVGNTFGTKLGQESSIVLWHVVHGELKSGRLILPSIISAIWQPTQIS